MNQYRSGKSLIQAIERASLRFAECDQPSQGVYFDHIFLRNILTPFLVARLESGCRIEPDWIWGLWAAHLGLSEQTSLRHKELITEKANSFIKILRTDLERTSRKPALYASFLSA